MTMIWQQTVPSDDGAAAAALPETVGALPPVEMARLCLVRSTVEAQQYCDALTKLGIPVAVGETTLVDSNGRVQPTALELLVPDASYDRACEIIAGLHVADGDDPVVDENGDSQEDEDDDFDDEEDDDEEDDDDLDDDDDDDDDEDDDV